MNKWSEFHVDKAPAFLSFQWLTGFWLALLKFCRRDYELLEERQKELLETLSSGNPEELNSSVEEFTPKTQDQAYLLAKVLALRLDEVQVRLQNLEKEKASRNSSDVHSMSMRIFNAASRDKEEAKQRKEVENLLGKVDDENIAKEKEHFSFWNWMPSLASWLER